MAMPPLWHGCWQRRKVSFMRGVHTRLASLLLLCAIGAAQTTNTVQSPAGEDQQALSATDLYEVVLRYQIKSWQLAADSYCVEVNGKDASKELLNRFMSLPVKPASACRKKTTQRVMMRVVDRKSGKMSVIFDMFQIRWRTVSEAEIDGGYLCGSECMAGGTYHLKWDGNRWAVTEYDIQVQS
jgi:hypothetical protein